MRARRLRMTLALAVGGVLVGGGRLCAAETKIHLLVIGNNQAFASTSGGTGDRPPLAPLQFADDDAAAFYDFMSEIADSGHLLTVMDRETEAAYPRLAPLVRAPTLHDLRAALAALGARMEDNRRHGHDNALYVFFSGHGSVDADGKPQLALLDGGISQQLLYQEILGALPADHVHLLIDACHAEAVVRPRDTDAQMVAVTPADAKAFVGESTLARFPHVGAIVAATTQAQTHEWDLLRHGVFTYELLSALRGTADVNRDGRVEYSEAYAFLKAANRGVEDPRARMSVVVHPPALDRRVALVDLSRFPRAGGVARLTGVPGKAGLVEVEDGAGRAVASLRGEAGYVADVLVPAGFAIYVRAGGKEAQFESQRGQVTSFGGLSFEAPRERPRGSIDDALRRGLFAVEFGRAYYTGLVDQGGELAPVSFAPEVVHRAAAPPPVRVDRDAAVARPAWSLFVGAGGSSAVARAFNVTEGVRVGARPGTNRGGIVSLDVMRAAGPNLVEWHMTASLGWAWSARWGAVQSWGGAAVGGGAIGQQVTAAPSRWSGVVEGGPAVGVGTNVTRRIGLWAEAQLFGLAYRRDDRTVLSPAPAAWIGISVGR